LSDGNNVAVLSSDAEAVSVAGAITEAVNVALTASVASGKASGTTHIDGLVDGKAKYPVDGLVLLDAAVLSLQADTHTHQNLTKMRVLTDALAGSCVVG
jgi:hypothetical protein